MIDSSGMAYRYEQDQQRGRQAQTKSSASPDESSLISDKTGFRRLWTRLDSVEIGHFYSVGWRSAGQSSVRFNLLRMLIRQCGVCVVMAAGWNRFPQYFRENSPGSPIRHIFHQQRSQLRRTYPGLWNTTDDIVWCTSLLRMSANQ